jgi:putative glutamine amidotransferase
MLLRGESSISSNRRRPLIGVMCCNRSVDGAAAQTVANRFIEPLTDLADVSVLLIPAIPGAIDAERHGDLLDGLLLTGAYSHLAARRYSGSGHDGDVDEGRDEVAFHIAGRMIEAGKPVFGICRGLQELNVLFGGSLAQDVGAAGHHRGGAHLPLAELFEHHHEVEIAESGMLGGWMGRGRHRVNSVHHQGIDRLGAGFDVEARAPDGLVEAISAAPCGAPVVGVQWHPEWDARANHASRAFFGLIGAAARGDHRPSSQSAGGMA